MGRNKYIIDGSLLHSKPHMPKKTPKAELCTVCALLSKDVAFPVGETRNEILKQDSYFIIFPVLVTRSHFVSISDRQ